MPRPYPMEFRRDVVAVARRGEAPLKQVAADFGIAESCLRNWLRDADVEDGNRPGVTRSESTELREANRRIRFSGYDGMFEIRFFLEIDALAKAFVGGISGEREYLSAFDTIRKKVLVAAEKAYGRGHGRTMCTLTIADFA